ncbi:MAG: ABC transporter ATP-binding protein [Verrucomicrobiota bacterium]
MKNWLRALNYFRPDAPRIAWIGGLLLLSIGANLLKPWPLAIIVDGVLGDKPLPAWLPTATDTAGKLALLPLLGGLIFLLHAAQGALSAAQNFIAIGVGLRGLTRVRNEVFSRLQRLSLRFHQGAQTGDTIYRAAWDTYSFQTLFQQGLVMFLTAALSLCLMVVVMWQLNVRLTLVALAIVPALILAIRVFGAAMRERGAAAQAADSRVISQVQQTIAALPLIQSYTREAQETERYRGLTQSAEAKRLAQHGWELLYWLGISVVFGIGTAAIVWVGAGQVAAGALTVGQLLIFIAYLAQLYEPLNQLSHVGATVSTASAGAQRVFELLDTPEEVRDHADARPIVSRVESAAAHSRALVIQGGLEFNRVSFAYQPGHPVFSEISFTLKPGETAALVGPSGAGKTTLLSLLPRFFDPSGGAVKLDGVDLRELRLQDLRANVALVPQQPVLLPATIAENIAFGKPDATRAEIEAAARAANADAFIAKLPQGYDTVVGEGAARLSVGEAQRLNLARAFLKNAPILLLDEPTSSLDAESEDAVLAGMTQLMKGRTTLIVAHRLRTIRSVDRILTLQDGRLAENGAHAELMEGGGYYARLAANAGVT